MNAHTDRHNISPIVIIMMMMALMGCSGGGGGDEAIQPTPPPTPTTPTEVAITFSGTRGVEQASETTGDAEARATRAANGANGATRANRAGSPLSDAATRFRVWGYKNMSYSAGSYGDQQSVFPGYIVNWLSNSAATTASNSRGWEYVAQETGSDPEQTIKYWDWGATAYRFFAVTGSTTHDPHEPNGPHEFGIAADATSTANIEATPYYSKLWFSTGDPVAYPDKQFGRPVVLEFLQPFTRVRFLFKYVHPREGIALTEVKFMQTADIGAAAADSVKIACKGTVTISYPLTGTATRESFTVTPDGDKSTRLPAFEVDYDPDDDTKVYPADCPGGWYTVLPNNTQGSFTLVAQVNGADRKAVVPASYMQWLPGYSYTYVFKITEEGGIEIGWVEYAMTPWTEQKANWEVYNW